MVEATTNAFLLVKGRPAKIVIDFWDDEDAPIDVTTPHYSLAMNG